LERDGVSEPLELDDEPLGDWLWGWAAGEVVPAEVVVGDVVFEDVVGGDQDRVGDGDDRLLGGRGGADPLALGAQVPVLERAAALAD
jgi:hypothetical protein